MKPRNQQINIRVTEEAQEAFEQAAAAVGLSVSSWLLLVGLHAAGHSELASQLSRIPSALQPKKPLSRR